MSCCFFSRVYFVLHIALLFKVYSSVRLLIFAYLKKAVLLCLDEYYYYYYRRHVGLICAGRIYNRMTQG